MKKKVESEYDEVEVELVMEAYGVGRARALTILRAKHRIADKKETVEQKAKSKRCRPRTLSDEDNWISAEEFFGV